jgi:hypothetical protein
MINMQISYQKTQPSTGSHFSVALNASDRLDHQISHLSFTVYGLSQLQISHWLVASGAAVSRVQFYNKTHIKTMKKLFQYYFISTDNKFILVPPCLWGI